MPTSDRDTKLVGIFVVAFILFNFPILGILGTRQYLIGVIPAVYIYIFVVWLFVIVATYHILDKKR